MNNKEKNKMTTEQMIKLAVCLLIMSIIFTTVKAVLIGIKEGAQNAKALMNGASYEQIQAKNKKKQDDEFERDLKKMDSKLYRYTHPVEYIGCLLMKKLREKVG